MSRAKVIDEEELIFRIFDARRRGNVCLGILESTRYQLFVKSRTKGTYLRLIVLSGLGKCFAIDVQSIDVKDNQPLNLNRNQPLIIFSYFFNSNGASDAGEKLLPLNFHILNKKNLNEFKVASIYINVIACGISQYVYKRIVTFLQPYVK